METIIIQIMRESAIAGLAAFAIYMLKAQMELRIHEQQEILAALHDDRTALLEALQNNTAAMIRTATILDALEKTVSRRKSCE